MTSRYHTVAAQVMTFDANGQPTGQYKSATVGLVGLHIVYKAPGFPQWTWATFEHVDNAPDASSATGTWSYFNPSCTGSFCAPNVSPLVSHAPFGTPNQVTRLSPIRPEITAVNTAWQARLNTTPFPVLSPDRPAVALRSTEPGQSRRAPRRRAPSRM